jgi:transcriptional regulator with XRE-family HTH domain
MTIGEKIKKLRRDNDITQEKLAEYLNISYQAVSKWENGSALPDISLVIPLANFFGVTTDVLFDLDSQAREADIKAFDEEGSRLANLGLVKEQITHWRKAVLRYPKNYHFLIMLAYALLGAKHSDICADDKQMTDYFEEAVSICDRVLTDCTDTENRTSAIQILVLFYGPGPFYNEEKAVETANKAASIVVSREILLEFALNGDKSKKQKHQDNLYFVDLLCSNLIYGQYNSTDEYIFAFETALGIYKMVFNDENYLFYHCRVADMHKELARFYAESQNKEKVMAHLKSAKEHAYLYDTIPEGEQHYTSPFLNMATHHNSSTSKNYTGSDTDLLRENLKQTHFDFLRDEPDFIEFEKSF